MWELGLKWFMYVSGEGRCWVCQEGNTVDGTAKQEVKKKITVEVCECIEGRHAGGEQDRGRFTEQ